MIDEIAEARKKKTSILPDPIRVPCSLIRAAMLCSARGELHDREDIKGICISAEGRIYGTNGHVCFAASTGAALPEDQVIAIDGGVPKKGIVELSWISESEGLAKIFPKMLDSVASSTLHFTVIGSRFPEIVRLIPSGQPASQPLISIAGKYLKLVGKVFGSKYATAIQAYGEPSQQLPYVARPRHSDHSLFPHYSEPLMLVMPMDRVRQEDE